MLSIKINRFLINFQIKFEKKIVSLLIVLTNLRFIFSLRQNIKCLPTQKSTWQNSISEIILNLYLKRVDKS